MSEKSMTLKIKKMLFIPAKFDVSYENIVGLSTYIPRGKPLKKQDVLAMVQNTELRNADRNKAALIKWSCFASIILLIFLAATLVVVFVH